MRTAIWINIGSVIVFILSATTWTLLTTDYLNISQEGSINVKGAKTAIANTDKNYKEHRTGESILESAITAVAVPEEEKLKEVEGPKKRDDAQDIYIRAKASIAMDLESETILYGKNVDTKLPIASLTKLVTALVVIDNIKNLDEKIVTIDKETCQVSPTIVGCTTSTYCFSDTLKENERVKAKDLFEAMLVNSANDAAIALAKEVAGSQEEFAKLMNKKAREMGLKNSHFCNPTGLDDDDHPKRCYSSAEDVAQVVIYAFKNEKYRAVWDAFRVKEKWFESVDGKLKHRFATTNILFDTMPGCLGAKTGFTYQAGKTLMLVASDKPNGRNKVVAVVLNDDYRFDDAKALIDWAFRSYRWK